jgi:hypothetical protein
MPIAAVETALRLKQEATNARNDAVVELFKLKKDVDAQLKLLGAAAEEEKPVKPKKGCTQCGSPDHDGRFHRNDPKPPKT